MNGRQRKTPAQLVEAWPEGPSSDDDADVARQFAQNLRSAIASRSIRSVAKAATLDEKTLRDILAGQVWPDLRSIARLERALQMPLFPQYGT